MTLPGVATIDTNGYAVTLSGPLPAAAALTKIGAGTLTLSRAPTTTRRSDHGQPGHARPGGTSVAAPLAWNPVLNLAGARITGGDLVFDYSRRRHRPATRRQDGDRRRHNLQQRGGPARARPAISRCDVTTTPSTRKVIVGLATPGDTNARRLGRRHGPEQRVVELRRHVRAPPGRWATSTATATSTART